MLERNVRVTFCSDVRIMTDGASHSRNKKTASHRSTNSVVTSPPCRPHPPSPLGATLPHVVVVAVAEVVEEEAEVAAEEEVGDVAAVKAEVVALMHATVRGRISEEMRLGKEDTIRRWRVQEDPVKL